MRLLLDTNAYSELRRGDAGVAELVRRATGIVFSPIVAGELLHGFRGGDRYETNRRELEAFLDSSWVALLPVGLATADRFARIAVSLRRKGRPIPTNDIWIAAHAMETGAELVSFDAYFEHVDEIVWRRPP